MSEHARNFLIGLATIFGLVAMVVLLLFFGEVRLFAPPEYRVTLYMTVAAGLREGSPVELNGVRIGRIVKIRLDERDPDFPVRVVGKIQHEKRIPMNVTATVEQSLLAGTAILLLLTRPPEPGETLAYIPDDGTGELWVEARMFIDQILAELDERTQPLLDSLDHFNRLSETYTELGQNLNALVGEFRANDDPEADPTDTDEPTLRAAVVKLNEVLDEAGNALRLASAWLEDEQLRTDFTRAVASANALIESATDTFQQFGRVAESLEGDAAALLQNLLPVTDELAATLADVRRLTRMATEGRGTVAQLINNPDLYESLVDAAIRLERTLIDAQLLIQKFQAEGVPIRW